MRSTLFICGAIVLAVACGGYKNEARTTTITSATMDGPPLSEQELPRTLRRTSEAIALGVCQHENYCGRTDDSCVDATVKQARSELMLWNCEPAAIRARLEECLVGFEAQSCDVKLLSDRQPLCPANAACSDHMAEQIPPGAALAKLWEFELGR